MTAASCSGAGTIVDPDTVCAGFDALTFEGEYDSTTLTGTPIIHEFINLVEDGNLDETNAKPFPLRNAPLVLWASGGVAYPDARLGLAMCKGADCASKEDPSFWVRRLKHQTDANGMLEFSTFVGYGVAGAVVVEFDNASCRIGVDSAELQ
jgi:hypothetical protein